MPLDQDPECEACRGQGRAGDALGVCELCQGSGRYQGEWKGVRRLLPREWPGMRAAFLYAATEHAREGFLDWAEFGVWRGNSARFLLKLFPYSHRSPVKLHLYDSFEGLPEDWKLGYGRGTLSVAAPPVFEDPRVVIHKGWFQDTLPSDPASRPAFDFVHVDSDLYSSAKVILSRISLHPGLVIAFDEYYDGENKALLETGVGFDVLHETEDGQVAVRLT